MVEKAIKEGDTDPPRHEVSDLQEKASKVEQQGGQEQDQNKKEEEVKLESGKGKNKEPSEEGHPQEQDAKGMLSFISAAKTKHLYGKFQFYTHGAWEVPRLSSLLACSIFCLPSLSIFSHEDQLVWTESNYTF